MCVKSLTASLWLVRTGRQHHPGEGEDRDIGQATLNIGLVAHESSGWLVGGGGEGGQLLSPLMSLSFFHQLSIYRAVQHSCVASHTPTCPHSSHTCTV